MQTRRGNIDEHHKSKPKLFDSTVHALLWACATARSAMQHAQGVTSKHLEHLSLWDSSRVQGADVLCHVSSEGMQSMLMGSPLERSSRREPLSLICLLKALAQQS